MHIAVCSLYFASDLVFAKYYNQNHSARTDFLLKFIPQGEFHSWNWDADWRKYKPRLGMEMLLFVTPLDLAK